MTALSWLLVVVVTLLWAAMFGAVAWRAAHSPAGKS
jgi:hypothetical protein